MNTLINKIRLCAFLCWSLFSVGGGVCLLWFAARCVARFFNTNVYDERLLYGSAAALAVVAIIIFIRVSLVEGVQTYVRFRVLPIIVYVLADRIEFVNKNAKYVVPKSDIAYIFKKRNCIILAWKVDDSIITFSFYKYYFSSRTMKELNNCFRDFPQYTEDPTEIRQISKRLKLNDSFRKNRYEYQIGKT
jgi:hypothetical protein